MDTRTVHVRHRGKTIQQGYIRGTASLIEYETSSEDPPALVICWCSTSRRECCRRYEYPMVWTYRISFGVQGR